MSETIESAKELGRYYMKKDIPTFVEGPPGVGKSDMWQQIANEEKIKLIDLRLPQMDPADLRGLPRHDGIYTAWARPDFWPVVERDGERGIILFDELADANKLMQSAAYQIILNGRAGPHIIPPGWYRCAAGNNQKHRAGAQAMSTALANRFAWIEVEADVKTFVRYGVKVGIHHTVLGFIQFRPNLLHTMEGATSKAFPSPRSWAMAAKVIDAPKEQRLRLIAGCVGEGPAGELEGYLRTLDIPSLDEILADPKRCPIPDKPASRYALTAMLAQEATRANLGKIGQYASRKEFGREFEVTLFLDASKRDTSLTELRSYVDFANRNQDLHL